jgi:hypothetical protein
VTAARGLLFGRGDIGQCRFDMDGASDHAPQQLVLKDRRQRRYRGVSVA